MGAVDNSLLVSTRQPNRQSWLIEVGLILQASAYMTVWGQLIHLEWRGMLAFWMAMLDALKRCASVDRAPESALCQWCVTVF